jgi:outer membrane protein OmpA-like peptidoglycan-associated protein
MSRGGVLFLLLAASCAAGGKLRSTQDVLRQDIEKARKSGAEKCAPKELALAEAYTDFAGNDIDLGQAGPAEEKLKVAEQNVKQALELSKDCGQKQVTVREEPKPVPIIIEKVERDSDGDGIPDDIDRCPLEPEDKDGFQDEDGCPDPDNDNDGVVDAMDACPNNPGPVENRGCPVLDRDGDGIPDSEDKCPDQAGVPPDGCPRRYTLLEVMRERIVIKQQVKFATAKYKVLPASYSLLNQVVQVLNDFPKMRVRIEGHTDNVGGEASNLKLSQKRAESVRAYLIAKGISPDRLEAVGYGMTRPISSNKTQKGRTQNRRTEFHIVSTGD